MKTNLAKKGLRGASSDVLWSAIKAEWERFKTEPSRIGVLYDSLPWQVASVVEAAGSANIERLVQPLFSLIKLFGESGQVIRSIPVESCLLWIDLFNKLVTKRRFELASRKGM